MKVLVVDDSIVYRSAISKALEEVEGLTELKTASNGKIALDLIKQGDYDLATIDIEMPVMDGITAIQEIRKFNKQIKIICFSSLTMNGAQKTIEALNAGANDFAAKVTDAENIEEGIELVRRELVQKVLSLTELKRVGPATSRKAKKSYAGGALPGNLCSFKPRVLCIGVSTGGPETLKTILKDISPSIKIPIVIVQHMPEFFTAKLAEHLTTICPLPVFESFEGQILEGGKIYLAKGNYHTTLKRESGEVVIHLDQGDKVCYVRPAVDLMFKSIGEVYGQLAFPIILTGMGSDGLNGCRFLKEVGCPIVIQDEESSVVWGMPGAVAEAEIQTNVVTLDNMAEIINKVCA